MSKLRKTFNALILMVAIFFGSFTFVACGEPKATSIRITGVEQTVLINTEHNLNDLKLVVSYNKGESKTVAKNSEMTITKIDTTKAGKQNLVVKYIGLEAKLEITVVETDAELYGIYGFEKPTWQTDWESTANGLVDGDGDYNTEAGANFLINNHADNPRKAAFASVQAGLLTYKVGDDNAFKYLPEITSIKVNDDGTVETLPLTNYKGTVKIEKKNGANWTELLGADRDAMVTVNSISSFDFTQQAVGSIFRITVAPVEAEADVDPASIEVEIVDAWNVYDVWELAVIDNSENALHEDDNGVYAWAEIKAQYGLNTPEAKGAKGVVLHNSFDLEVTDIPKAYVWADGSQDASSNDIGGTLKDAKTIYQRNNLATYNAEGELVSADKFSVYGNFHYISAKNIPYCTYLTHDKKQAHSFLLGFGGDNNNGLEKQNQGDAYVENLELEGNIGKTNVSDDGKYGIQGIITSSRNLHVINCISKMFQTQGGTMYAMCDDVATRKPTEFTYEFSQLLNTYSMVFGSWGSRHATLNHCVIKDAGGPIVAGTHVAIDRDESTIDWTDIQWPEVTMIDCEVSSLTATTAPWYAQFSSVIGQFNTIGTAMGQLATMVPTYKDGKVGKNFMTTVGESQAFSVLGVTTVSDGEDFAIDDYFKGRGIVNIKNSAESVDDKYDLQGTNIKTIQTVIDQQLKVMLGDAAYNMPLFISNGVYLSYNGENLIYVGTENNEGVLEKDSLVLENINSHLSAVLDFFLGDTCQIVMTDFGTMGVLNIVAEMFPVA